MATPETRRQLLAAVQACDDKKGEDTRILSLDPADSGLADFFLITSASNDRQVVAIADEIEMRLKKDFGVYAHSVEGRRQAEWILLDYVDIVIHVFLAEKRAFYDIERLRKSARPLTPGELDAEVEAELRSTLAAKTRAVRERVPISKAQKKAVRVASSTAIASSAVTPKSLPKGDSTVTAKKAAKKVAKKAAKKAIVKTGKAAKKAAPAAKVGLIAPSSGALGAKPPILKCEDPDAVAASVVEPVSGALGAKPPIVKCEDPEAGSVAASAAPTAAKKAAKKAAKNAPAKAAKKAAAKKTKR